MDSSERQRYKQLANDSIIATYGYDNAQSRLAEALEKCLEELEKSNTAPHCSSCQCVLPGASEAFTYGRITK